MERKFINYAHRGASEYYPENTEPAFFAGLYMGANGFECDVQRTRDGQLVLFHDETLERVTGAAGSIDAYTYEELCAFDVRRNNCRGKIARLVDFLDTFAHLDITFAMELKVAGCEADLYDAIIKYNCLDKVIVTSFDYEYLKKMREVSSDIRLGYLTSRTDEGLIEELREISAYEICPKADTVTAELVNFWHGAGLNVRAWGVSDEETMKKVYDAGVDGMTVNFPDKLTAYIEEKGQ